jgi:hypothetical protein
VAWDRKGTNNKKPFVSSKIEMRMKNSSSQARAKEIFLCWEKV